MTLALTQASFYFFFLIRRFYLSNTDLNQAAPILRWLEVLHQQKLGRDFYREKAEAKSGNHGLAIA